VTADHIMGGVAEEPFGGRVPGGDDPPEVKAHDGVHRRLDDGGQAALRGLRLPPLGHVPSDGGHAEHLAAGARDQRRSQPDGHQTPVFAPPFRLVLPDALAPEQPSDEVLLLAGPVPRDEHRHRPPDRLTAGIAIQGLRAGIPARDDAIERLAHNGVRRRLHNGRKAPSKPIDVLGLGVGDQNSPKAGRSSFVRQLGHPDDSHRIRPIKSDRSSSPRGGERNGQPPSNSTGTEG
jgi:hypothetical protein